MSTTFTTNQLDALAALASANGAHNIHRIKDEDLRNQARNALTEARATARKLIAALDDECDDETVTAAIERMRKQFWPRMRTARKSLRDVARDLATLELALKSPLATAQEFDTSNAPRYVLDALTVARAFDAPTIESAYLDALMREQRLTGYLARLQDLADRAGMVPLVARWMDTSHSPLVGTAANRRFLFRGGRDAISDGDDHEDILQEGFTRAIESGDCNADNVPYIGGIYRHIQAARAHATRVKGAEYRARVSFFDGVKGEPAYPDTDDKHTMRLLGTKNYGTRDTHAAAMRDKQRAEESRILNEHMADQSRKHAAENTVLFSSEEANGEDYALKVANALLSGLTVEQICAALGTTPSTILRKVQETRDKVKPSEWSWETDDDAEREFAEFRAMSAHADMLRKRQNLAMRADYIRNNSAGTPVEREPYRYVKPVVSYADSRSKPLGYRVVIEDDGVKRSERFATLNEAEDYADMMTVVLETVDSLFTIEIRAIRD